MPQPISRLTSFYSQSGFSLTRTLLKTVPKTTENIANDIHIRDHLNKGMLIKFEKSILCFGEFSALSFAQVQPLFQSLAHPVAPVIFKR